MDSPTQREWNDTAVMQARRELAEGKVADAMRTLQMYMTASEADQAAKNWEARAVAAGRD